MFDILLYLFENYFEAGRCPDPATLTHKLTMAGFEDDEITLALDWLSGLSENDADRYPASLIESRSLRHFSAEEMEVIDIEGRGFILFLEQTGIINPLQRELLIERVIEMDGDHASLEKIKLVVLFDLWMQNRLSEHSIAEKLFVVSDSHSRH